MTDSQANGGTQPSSVTASSPSVSADEAVDHKQAAQVLGVTVRTVRRLVERGDLDRANADTTKSARGAFVTKRSLAALRERRKRADDDNAAEPSKRGGSLSSSQLKALFSELVQPVHERLWDAQQQAAAARAEASAERAQRRLLDEHTASLREQAREREQREHALEAELRTARAELAATRERTREAERAAEELTQWQGRLARAGWRESLGMLLRTRRSSDRHSAV